MTARLGPWVARVTERLGPEALAAGLTTIALLIAAALVLALLLAGR